MEEFKERVPFSTYDDYAPYIERMINNDEKNLITVYPIEHYAVSSGSVGVPKRIPRLARDPGPLQPQLLKPFFRAR